MKNIHQTRLIYGGTILLCLSAAAYGFLIDHQQLPPPASTCYFVSLFGIPCAGCGGSHALQAMLQGEGVTAFLFNPLVAVFMTGLLILCCLALIDLAFNKRILVLSFNAFQSELRNRKFSLGLAGLLMAHWAYIIVKYFTG